MASTETRISQLDELVFKDKKNVFVSDLVDFLDIHIDDAHELMKKFIEQNKEKLDVNYHIYGFANKDEDLNIQRFIVVKSDEIEDAKKKLVEVTNCALWSVEAKCDENLDESQNECSFVVREATMPTDISEIISRQKKTYIINEDIKLRPEILLRMSQMTIKDEPKPKEDSELKSTPKKKIRTSAIENMFKSKSTEKSEETNGDVKEEKMESEEPEIKIESFDDMVWREENKETKPVQVKPESEGEQEPVKRKKAEISKPKSKKNESKSSTKRKRVRVFSSSEDDDDEAENKNRKAISDDDEERPAPPAENRKIKETQWVDEIFEDEEGYTVTKRVTKTIEVEVETKPASKPKPMNGSEKESGDDNSIEKKPAKGRPTKAAIAKKVPKGQVSIMSFFTPGNKN